MPFLQKMSGSENYEFEPDWINAKAATIAPEHRLLVNFFASAGSAPEKKPIMQTDYLKPFYKLIVEKGLHEAYISYRNKPDPFTSASGREINIDDHPAQTHHPKNVVIIGAGIAGLVAGYELARAGHKVRILEMQHRVGGRVKTASNESFYPGLWSDGKSTYYVISHSPSRTQAHASTHFIG